MPRTLPISIAPANTVEELRLNLVTELQRLAERLAVDTNDAKGRAIRNVGHAVGMTDAVNLQMLRAAVDKIGSGGTTGRTSNYVNHTQGLLTSIPTGLVALNAGSTYYATDYDHQFYWTGLAWSWAPGELHSGAFQLWDHDPGAGWHICDGSTVTRCKTTGDGTTESVTLPNATGCYIKHGTYSAVPVVALAPGLTGETADNGLHTHTGTLAVGAASGSVAAGSGVASAAIAGHTHALTGGLNTDGYHRHTKGTLLVDATAEPKHLTIPLYMRL